MNKKSFLFIVIIPLVLLLALSVEASEIRLSVAASMTNAFRDVARTFEATHPDVKVHLNFASSGSLAKQIAHGAPADMFVSANPKWMSFLNEKGRTVEKTIRVFAYNTLVIVGNPASSLSSLKDLASLKRIAIGSPGSVPAGQYAKQAMDHVGVYDSLVKANKLVMAKDVRQALLYADRKEVDVAFVYKTDSLLAKNCGIIFVVPASYYDRVSYPMALTVIGASNPSAKLFYDFMFQPEVVKIINTYGFEAEQKRM